ncbi:MAG: MAP7 domain-containing protein, partial [Candidatus Omnitrophota bacterium]
MVQLSLFSQAKQSRQFLDSVLNKSEISPNIPTGSSSPIDIEKVKTLVRETSSLSNCLACSVTLIWTLAQLKERAQLMGMMHEGETEPYHYYVHTETWGAVDISPERHPAGEELKGAEMPLDVLIRTASHPMITETIGKIGSAIRLCAADFELDSDTDSSSPLTYGLIDSNGLGFGVSSTIDSRDLLRWKHRSMEGVFEQEIKSRMQAMLEQACAVNKDVKASKDLQDLAGRFVETYGQLPRMADSILSVFQDASLKQGLQFKFTRLWMVGGRVKGKPFKVVDAAEGIRHESDIDLFLEVSSEWDNVLLGPDFSWKQGTAFIDRAYNPLNRTLFGFVENLRSQLPVYLDLLEPVVPYIAIQLIPRRDSEDLIVFHDDRMLLGWRENPVLSSEVIRQRVSEAINTFSSPVNKLGDISNRVMPIAAMETVKRDLKNRTTYVPGLKTVQSLKAPITEVKQEMNVYARRRFTGIKEYEDILNLSENTPVAATVSVFSSPMQMVGSGLSSFLETFKPLETKRLLAFQKAFKSDWHDPVMDMHYSFIVELERSSWFKGKGFGLRLIDQHTADSLSPVAVFDFDRRDNVVLDYLWLRGVPFIDSELYPGDGRYRDLHYHGLGSRIVKILGGFVKNNKAFRMTGLNNPQALCVLVSGTDAWKFNQQLQHLVGRGLRSIYETYSAKEKNGFKVDWTLWSKILENAGLRQDDLGVFDWLGFYQADTDVLKSYLVHSLSEQSSLSFHRSVSLTSCGVMLNRAGFTRFKLCWELENGLIIEGYRDRQDASFVKKLIKGCFSSPLVKPVYVVNNIPALGKLEFAPDAFSGNQMNIIIDGKNAGSFGLVENRREKTVSVYNFGLFKNYRGMGFGSLVYAEIPKMVMAQYPQMNWIITRDVVNPAILNIHQKMFGQTAVAVGNNWVEAGALKAGLPEVLALTPKNHYKKCLTVRSSMPQMIKPLSVSSSVGLFEIGLKVGATVVTGLLASEFASKKMNYSALASTLLLGSNIFMCLNSSHIGPYLDVAFYTSVVAGVYEFYKLAKTKIDDFEAPIQPLDYKKVNRIAVGVLAALTAQELLSKFPVTNALISQIYYKHNILCPGNTRRLTYDLWDIARYSAGFVGFVAFNKKIFGKSQRRFNNRASSAVRENDFGKDAIERLVVSSSVNKVAEGNSKRDLVEAMRLYQRFLIMTPDTGIFRMEKEFEGRQIVNVTYFGGENTAVKPFEPAGIIFGTNGCFNCAGVVGRALGQPGQTNGAVFHQEYSLVDEDFYITRKAAEITSLAKELKESGVLVVAHQTAVSDLINGVKRKLKSDTSSFKILFIERDTVQQHSCDIVATLAGVAVSTLEKNLSSDNKVLYVADWGRIEKVIGRNHLVSAKLDSVFEKISSSALSSMPYKEEDINTDYEELDELFKGGITQEIMSVFDQYRKPVKVHVIGGGRNTELQMKAQFKERVSLTSTALHDLFQFSELGVPQDMALSWAETLRKGLIIQDINQGLRVGYHKFDVVVVGTMVVPYVKDKLALLPEIQRVLRRNGKAFVADFGPVIFGGVKDLQASNITQYPLTHTLSVNVNLGGHDTAKILSVVSMPAPADLILPNITFAKTPQIIIPKLKAVWPLFYGRITKYISVYPYHFVSSSLASETRVELTAQSLKSLGQNDLHFGAKPLMVSSPIDREKIKNLARNSSYVCKETYPRIEFIQDLSFRCRNRLSFDSAPDLYFPMVKLLAIRKKALGEEIRDGEYKTILLVGAETKVLPKQLEKTLPHLEKIYVVNPDFRFMKEGVREEIQGKIHFIQDVVQNIMQYHINPPDFSFSSGLFAMEFMPFLQGPGTYLEMMQAMADVMPVNGEMIIAAGCYEENTQLLHAIKEVGLVVRSIGGEGNEVYWIRKMQKVVEQNKELKKIDNLHSSPVCQLMGVSVGQIASSSLIQGAFTQIFSGQLLEDMKINRTLKQIEKATSRHNAAHISRDFVYGKILPIDRLPVLEEILRSINEKMRFFSELENYKYYHVLNAVFEASTKRGEVAIGVDQALIFARDLKLLTLHWDNMLISSFSTAAQEGKNNMSLFIASLNRLLQKEREWQQQQEELRKQRMEQSRMAEERLRQKRDARYREEAGAQCRRQEEARRQAAQEAERRATEDYRKQRTSSAQGESVNQGPRVSTVRPSTRFDQEKRYRSWEGAMSVKDAYDILGLSKGDSLTEARRVRNEWMMQYHPHRTQFDNISAFDREKNDVAGRNINMAVKVIDMSFDEKASSSLNTFTSISDWQKRVAAGASIPVHVIAYPENAPVHVSRVAIPELASLTTQ